MLIGRRCRIVELERVTLNVANGGIVFSTKSSIVIECGEVVPGVRSRIGRPVVASMCRWVSAYWSDRLTLDRP